MGTERPPIQPEDPHPEACPPGMFGRPPWCYYPSVRAFLRLVMTDSDGKPSAARVASLGCLAVAALLVLNAVILHALGLDGLPEASSWVGWFLAAGGGVNAAGRWGRLR